VKNNKITVNSRYESENKNKVKETKKTTTKSTVKAEEHKENKMKKTKAQEKAEEEEKTEEKVAAAAAREEEKAKAKEEANNKMKNKNKKRSEEDNPGEDYQKKLDAMIKEKMANLPKCKGGNGDGDGDGNNHGLIGGTNVFDKLKNATDAVGYVGFTNYSVHKPPYKVKRCDQILLIPGKKLDPKDYCKKEDAFMTMSLYMTNFFLKIDPNKLVESYPLEQINNVPAPLPGAPGCTMWTTKKRSFPFCYDSPDIMDQVIEAYFAFMGCRRGPQGPLIAAMLLKACDPSKLDLGMNGPFGRKGPMYKEMMRAMDPDFDKPKKGKKELPDINPYYIYDDRVNVPGSFMNNLPTRMNMYGKNPYNPNTPNMFSPGA